MASTTIVQPSIANVASITDPVYAYSSDNGFFTAEFASSIGTANAVNFTRNGYAFGWKPNNVIYVDSAGNLDVVFGVNQSASAQIYQNRVTFVGTSQITSDEFECHGNELKHTIRMVAPPRIPASFVGTPTQMASGGVITYDSRLSIYANGQTQTADFEVTGDIGFKDADGNLIYKLPMITATDADGNTTQGTYKVTFNADGTISFYGMVPWNWLQTASYPVLIDPTVVVASAYDISNAGGRKTVRLSNNWIVAVTYNSLNTTTYWYVSKDNGSTFSLLTSVANTASAGFAMASTATTVYTLAGFAGGGTNSVICFKFDATTVPTTLTSGWTYPETASQSSLSSGVSLAIDGTGALHATWCSKNSTYPNSNNIRYSKSTDGGTTWATPTQITTNNTSGDIGGENPCIIVDSSNKPHIVCDQHVTGTYYIEAFNWNGTAWAGAIVYSNASYTQSSPCAAIDGNGAIHVVWHGEDATYTGTNQIKYSKSADGGSTWSAMANLTTVSTAGQHQEFPSISVDEGGSNNLYVLWQGIDSAVNATYYNIRKIEYSSGTWGAISTITNNTTANASSPQTLWSEFNMNSTDAVRYIWQNNQTAGVDYDSITLNSPPNAPTLATHSNFDATVAQTLAWTFSDPNSGDTQSAYQLQIVDTGNSTTVVDTGKVGSTTSSYSLAASTLTNGHNYQWRVQTWDQSGAQGPWSTYSTFKCSATPTATLTTPTANQTVTQNSITAQGTYSQSAGVVQQSFEFKLWDSVGTTLITDSGTITGTSNMYTFNNLANNTSYKAEFIVTSQDGIAASSGKVAFSAAFTPPAPPIVTLANNATNAKVSVTFTNPPSENLVENSGFEVVTTTSTLFSDALTAGTTADPTWTVQSGSFTWSTSGATSGASNAVMTAGNSAWRPLLGSDGTTKLSIKGQTNLTTPSSITSTIDLILELRQDSNNFYIAQAGYGGTGNTFTIAKYSGGTWTQIAQSAFTWVASTTYTFTLSLDNTGLLTATCTPSGGATTTISGTDSSPLSGGFLTGVGGDTGVVISNTSVTGPWANGWTIGGDSRVAWGLTQSSIGGKYSVSAVGVASLHGYANVSASVSTSQTYTLSGYINGTNVGTGGSAFYTDIGAGFGTSGITGTVSTERVNKSGSSGASTTGNVYLEMYDSGTVTFDNIQLEQGSTATPYIENDSTTGPLIPPSASSNNVYRRKTGDTTQKLVQQGVTSPYNDYTCPAGSYDYGVSAVSSNSAESAITWATVAVSFDGERVVDESNSANNVIFRYNQRKQDRKTEQDFAVVKTFAKYPRVRKSQARYRSGTLSALYVQSDGDVVSQLDKVDAMCNSDNTYLLKSVNGRIYRVVLSNLQDGTAYGGQLGNISVDWTEVGDV